MNQNPQFEVKLISPRVFYERLVKQIGSPPSLRTIYRLIDEGKIRSVRLSPRIIRIPEDEVVRYLGAEPR